jgi:tagatose-6-phosphate ketose/aldose isomerase
VNLLAQSETEQQTRGYFHTLHEILQQPETWLDTCHRMLASAPQLSELADSLTSVTLTGSGSSLYAGECVQLVLQQELGITVEALSAGLLVTHGSAALPTGRPGLLVSIARSGDSPESAATISMALVREPDVRHLVITCNESGQLHRTYRNHPRVCVILLDDRINDRSLAMTSSVTNMALAARFLGFSRAPGGYRLLCERLSRACQVLLDRAPDSIARIAATGFRRAVFLGSGSRFGGAREAALKMLEMTDGRVATLAESYLGLRHGPMTYIHPDTLVVCFLSSDRLLRAYETDLIGGLDRQHLGLAKVIFGENIPAGLVRPDDLAIECPGLSQIGDQNAALLDVVIGQWLALYRCLSEGLRPDSPCESGVIHRVVESFPVHGVRGVSQS